MAFFYISVNLIIWKLKSKHLVCLNYLWWQVFWGKERKYFPHIPDLEDKSIIKHFDRITQPLHPVTLYLGNIFKDLSSEKYFPQIPGLEDKSIIKLFDRITQPLHPVTLYLGNIFKDLSLEKLGNLVRPGMAIEGYIKRSFIFSYPPFGIRQ